MAGTASILGGSLGVPTVVERPKKLRSRGEKLKNAKKSDFEKLKNATKSDFEKLKNVKKRVLTRPEKEQKNASRKLKDEPTSASIADSILEIISARLAYSTPS